MSARQKALRRRHGETAEQHIARTTPIYEQMDREAADREEERRKEEVVDPWSMRCAVEEAETVEDLKAVMLRLIDALETKS